MVCDHRVYLL